MHAVLAEHAEASFRVAEDDEVFAEHPGSHRRAVRFGDFLGQAGGEPMAAHDLAHRPIAFDTGEKVVVFPSDHDTRQNT